MKDKTLFVNEIFGSIDGEGLRTGELATFIRLNGCNLRCKYCDTMYAVEHCVGKIMTIDEIVKKCQEISYKNITLTGGEPLIHKNVEELIDALIENGFYVNIETNGSVDITKYLNKPVIITMDFKTYASGETNKMLMSNLEKLRKNDCLKFVCSKEDLDLVLNVLENYNVISYIYLSPVFKQIEPADLVEFMKKINKRVNTSKMRVQVQLHKILWDPEMRGV